MLRMTCKEAATYGKNFKARVTPEQKARVKTGFQKTRI